jgi:transposase
MRTKDIKITYDGLIKQRSKLSNKRGWIDKRLTEITEPALIIKLNDEGLLTDSKIIDIDRQVNRLEIDYKFLKTYKEI